MLYTDRSKWLCVFVALTLACGSAMTQGDSVQPSQPEFNSTEPAIECRAYGRHLQLVHALFEAYKASNPDTAIRVTPAAESEGASGLADTSCEISVLPRRPSKTELQRVRKTRRQSLVAIPIALDAVVLLVPQATDLDELTLEQVGRVYTGEINEWTSLGITIPELPADYYPLIHRSMLKDHTGAPDVVQRLAIKKGGFTLARELFLNSAKVVADVENDYLAIGMVQWDFESDLKVVPIKASDDTPAVTPTTKTIRSREYPLVQYVYFCFAGQPKGDARDFLRFVLSNAGQQAIADAGLGFVTLHEVDKKQAQP